MQPSEPTSRVSCPSDLFVWLREPHDMISLYMPSIISHMTVIQYLTAMSLVPCLRYSISSSYINGPPRPQVIWTETCRQAWIQSTNCDTRLLCYKPLARRRHSPSSIMRRHDVRCCATCNTQQQHGPRFIELSSSEDIEYRHRYPDKSMVLPYDFLLPFVEVTNLLVRLRGTITGE